MKLTTTQDRELSLIRALVYGDSGIGKTTSLGTLPEATTLLVTGERGALPLRHKKYKVVQFDNWEDLRTVMLQLSGGEGELQEQLDGIRTIAVDSLSEISQACVRHIVQVERRKLLQERGRETPQNIYEELMAMEDWGLYRTRMLNLVSAFCHLPYHVVFTSLASWLKDKHGNETLRVPNLSGKAATEVEAYFDVVVYMESDEQGERKWRTFHDGQVIAKDASGVLAQYEETDWTKVFSKILNGANANAKTK